MRRNKLASMAAVALAMTAFAACGDDDDTNNDIDDGGVTDTLELAPLDTSEVTTAGS